MAIDSSLAHGLAKAEVKKALSRRVLTQAKALAPTFKGMFKKKRRARYKSICEFLGRSYKDCMIFHVKEGDFDGKNKRSSLTVCYWRSYEDHVGVSLTYVRAIDGAVANAQLAHLGQHALARLMQLYKDTDLESVMRLFSDNVRELLQLICCEGPSPDLTGSNLALISEYGVIICELQPSLTPNDFPFLTVKTAIHHAANLTGHKKILYENAVTSGRSYVSWPPQNTEALTKE